MYGFEFNQSGIIPFKISQGQLKYILITSNKSGQWIFPKGMIEPDMTPSESAANEGWEEAGVTGTVYDDVICSYKYSWEGLSFAVDMYPFKVKQVLDDWQEPWRKRRLCTFDEALVCINSDLLDVLKKGNKYILSKFGEEL